MSPIKLRLTLSWVFMGVGFALGLFDSFYGMAPGNPLLNALLGGYTAWSGYWGIPAFVRFWLRIRFGSEVIPLLFKFWLGLLLVLPGGILYGCWGGGVLEYFRLRSRLR